jgi:deferrochelatase/peroxidase EfeB
VDFWVTLNADNAQNVVAELQQILQELGLTGTVRIE